MSGTWREMICRELRESAGAANHANKQEEVENAKVIVDYQKRLSAKSIIVTLSVGDRNRATIRGLTKKTACSKRLNSFTFGLCRS